MGSVNEEYLPRSKAFKAEQRDENGVQTNNFMKTKLKRKSNFFVKELKASIAKRYLDLY